MLTLPVSSLSRLTDEVTERVIVCFVSLDYSGSGQVPLGGLG